MAEHGQLKPKWLPIQAVHTLWNSCAFIVLSGNVMHEGTWNKWREAAKPDDWKIMTKVEHTKRTAEYLALLQKENPKGMRKLVEDTSRLPPIARPAALSMAFDPLPEDSSSKIEDKKKRKRRKPAKLGHGAGGAAEQGGNPANQGAAQESDTGIVNAPQDVQAAIAESTTNKRKRKRRKSGKPDSTVNDAATNAGTAPDADEEPGKKRRC